ncbi:hypothetical protein M2S00_06755 [Apilactobacillus sp. TMW 2.2459]|uniref:hypothetical protein n=1 Tax=Apilactobacillus xinyiensis TaxID=2841032 RepID=UPI00200F1284|nr:hypothetical protein [Apilactobacillus xinyiensis]MCL0312804.1 hypothetical protein [Apilactobacillus xinyiensis]
MDNFEKNFAKMQKGHTRFSKRVKKEQKQMDKEYRKMKRENDEFFKRFGFKKFGL